MIIMDRLLPFIIMGGFFALAFVTANLPRKIQGVLAIVSAVVFLIFAIAERGNRPEYRFASLLLALFAVAGGLEKLGVCSTAIPRSRLPYRVDGIIGLIAAGAFLILGIVLPTSRFIFVFSGLLVITFALRRLGVSSWTTLS